MVMESTVVIIKCDWDNFYFKHIIVTVDNIKRWFVPSRWTISNWRAEINIEKYLKNWVGIQRPTVFPAQGWCPEQKFSSNTFLRLHSVLNSILV